MEEQQLETIDTTEATPAEKRFAIQREAMIVNHQLYQANIGYVAWSLRLNHLEDRTNRVQFHKRRNLMRDIRRLHDLRDDVRKRAESVNKLKQQLEYLEKAFNSLAV